MFWRPQTYTLIPYTTLFRSRAHAQEFVDLHVSLLPNAEGSVGRLVFHSRVPPAVEMKYVIGGRQVDRKSTRLNSSHTVISYAVFCLKKKNNSYKVKLLAEM